MKLILHIGQSKTGTTALQSFLLANKKRLIQEGILYPDYRLSNMPLNTLNHNSFAEELAGLTRHPRFSAEEYFCQFLEEMEQTKCHTMLLSAESFFGAPQIWRLKETQDFWDVYKQKLERLRKFTKNFDTQIIGYFRAPEDWFESAVSQIIRYEGLLSKKVYGNNKQIFSLLSPHLDYAKTLTLWHDIVQPKQMTILPYERTKLVEQDIIIDFCAQTNLTPFTLDLEIPKTETHSSLDRHYVAVKELLNKQPHTKTQERVMIECLDRLNARLSHIEKYQIDKLLRSELETYCRPFHKQMTQSYGQNGQPFFQHDQKKLENRKELTDKDIQKALTEFETLYKSWPMKVLRYNVGTKTFLRNKYPRVYAFIKNLASH